MECESVASELVDENPSRDSGITELNAGLDKFSICNMEENSALATSSTGNVAESLLPPQETQDEALEPSTPSIPEPDNEEICLRVPENSIPESHSSQPSPSHSPSPNHVAEDRCQQLESQLAEKDLLIATLQRSCGLLEKETSLSKRELEISLREKESAVMRYAIVEKKVIDANLARDAVEKKLKEGQKEIEVLNHKFRLMNTEKARMCQIVDQKCADIRHHQREMEKMKMDISMWESTNKASTAKLKQETEAKAAAEQKIHELTVELESFRSAEKAQLKSEVDTERLQVLEKQTVEQQADLILYKHEAAKKESRIMELEKRVVQLTGEIKENQERHSTMATENSNYKETDQKQKVEIFDLQNLLDKEVMKVAELQAKVHDLESIRAQLRIEKDSNSHLTEQLRKTREELEETNCSVDKLRLREEELLSINQELTECVAGLQNELSRHKSTSMALTLENATIGKEKRSFDEKLEALEKELKEEKRLRVEETVRLEGELSDRRTLVESLELKLETALGDMDALRNKHNQSLKEFNRELMLAQKKCAKLEQLRVGDNSDCNSLKSDNASDSESVSRNGHEIVSSGHARKASDSSLPGVAIAEPSKQSLIDRIVRLQQANAKQTEKLDFLENHSATLVSELQKKSKLVHYYMMRDQSGALVSAKSDKHKAELVKYGGIMSAIYGGVRGNTANSEMTLDLSLEINRKLQAVLEDTLLKNITLKENLDTLGLEVDKLTRRMANK